MIAIRTVKDKPAITTRKVMNGILLRRRFLGPTRILYTIWSQKLLILNVELNIILNIRNL